MAYLAKLKGKEESATIWSHPRQIASGSGWVCWHRPAAVTSVFINGKGRKAWVPDLIFVGGRKQRVWAVAGDRLHPSTKLRLTGWSNTYADGGICWGSSIVPSSLNPTDWEDAFFASSFATATNLSSTKPYAISKLKAYNQTLGQALGSLSPSSD